MHYEDTYNESPLWNRIAIVALTLMAAAYLFAVISPAVSSAGADDQRRPARGWVRRHGREPRR